MTFRTAKNLCPNLQKPPLPSKIPGCAHGCVLQAELDDLDTATKEKLKSVNVCNNQKSIFGEACLSELKIAVEKLQEMYPIK